MIAEPEGDDSDSAAHQDPELDDATQIWEHVKSLKRRVASLN